MLQRMPIMRPSNYIGTTTLAAQIARWCSHHGAPPNHIDLAGMRDAGSGDSQRRRPVESEAIGPLLALCYAGSQAAAGSVTACPERDRQLAAALPRHCVKAMHQAGGLFWTLPVSRPYVAIDMHLADPLQALDAIFSRRTFLAVPWRLRHSAFNRALYGAPVPDQPGGGTVT